MKLSTARRFSDAWCDAYRWRSKSYGPVMPLDEYRRMMIALQRMNAAFDREFAIRDKEKRSS